MYRINSLTVRKTSLLSLKSATIFGKFEEKLSECESNKNRRPNCIFPPLGMHIKSVEIYYNLGFKIDKF